MRKNRAASKWLFLLALVLLATAGCASINTDDIVLTMPATQAESTLSPASEESTPGGAAFQTQPFPITGVSSPTSTLSSSQGAPMVSVNANTICRGGPGKMYDNLGLLEVGEQAEVVGRSADSEYWVIKNPDQAGECWLWYYYATVVGSKDELAVYTPPPLPSPSATATPSPTATPVFVWEGNWSVSSGSGEGGNALVYDMNVTVVGDSFTARVDYLGNLVTYRGRVSDDLFSVSGTWSDLTRGGLFRFYALGNNQFQGYSAFGNVNTALCGWRGGAGMPSPCYRE